jgi:hypothetical protein
VAARAQHSREYRAANFFRLRRLDAYDILRIGDVKTGGNLTQSDELTRLCGDDGPGLTVSDPVFAFPGEPDLLGIELSNAGANQINTDRTKADCNDKLTATTQS